MSEKILKSRIVHKHDVAANWALATNFSPLKGEIIIYDPDDNNEQPRVKVGDGETNVNDLPFVTDVAKPTDLVVNMTAGFVTGKGIVYSCDTSFADMWAAYELGGDVMFYIDGIHTSNVEFLIARADGTKSIHLAYINGDVYFEYTINEDDTITWKFDNLITGTNLEETTGTDTTAVMSQKAVTDALALKADQTALDEVSALVGDTAVSDQIGAAIDAIPSNSMLVTFTANGTNKLLADKTIAEILEAYNNGVNVVGFYLNTLFTLTSVGNNLPQFASHIGAWYETTNGRECLYTAYRNIYMNTDSDIYYYQRLEQGLEKDRYNTLTTTDKTVIGAINELDAEIQPMTIAEIDAICTMDDVTALVIAEYLAEATDNEGNTLTDNENNTYVF